MFKNLNLILNQENFKFSSNCSNILATFILVLNFNILKFFCSNFRILKFKNVSTFLNSNDFQTFLNNFIAKLRSLIESYHVEKFINLIDWKSNLNVVNIQTKTHIHTLNHELGLMAGDDFFYFFFCMPSMIPLFYQHYNFSSLTLYANLSL